MIQFQCPHCAAVLRVPDSAMGQRGKCPQCQKSLLVPSPPRTPDSLTPPPPTSSAAIPSVTSPPASATSFPTGEDGVGELFSAISQTATTTRKSEDPLLNMRRRARRRNSGSLMTALFFLLLAAGLGAGGYYLWRPRMQGEMTAQVVAGDQISPRTLTLKQIGEPQLYEALLKTHRNDRISINSQMLETSLTVETEGLVFRVYPAAMNDLYQVEILQNGLLRAYYAENYLRLEALREADVRQTTSDFLQEITTAEQVLRGNPANLLRYRDQMILPAMVDGLGYHLAAFAEGKQFPCVWQDKEDRLYFILPNGTREFEIRERKVAGQPLQFPADLKFMVACPDAKKRQPHEWSYHHMWAEEKSQSAEEPTAEKSTASESAPAEPDPEKPDSESADGSSPMNPETMSEPMTE